MLTLKTLLEYLRTGDTLQRHTAYALLPTLGGDTLLRALTETLHNGDAGARWRAAQLLGWLGDAAAVESLISALSDEAWEVRFSAVWALAVLCHPRGGEALRDVFHNTRSEEQVRFTAASGLLAGGAASLLVAVSADEERLARPAQAVLAIEREKNTDAPPL